MVPMARAWLGRGSVQAATVTKVTFRTPEPGVTAAGTKVSLT